MRWHFRIVTILAVALAGYSVLLAAFHLMNQPSNRALWSGISLIVTLLLVVPVLIRLIWRSL